MTTAQHHPAGTESRLAAAGRLMGLMTVLVAPTLALAATVGWPLPRGPVDPAVVVDSILSGLVPTSVWINVLAVAAWLTWVAVAAMVAVDVVAIVRDRPSSPRTPRFVRQLAQVVVSSALVLAGPAQTALAGGAAHAAPPAAAAVEDDRAAAAIVDIPAVGVGQELVEIVEPNSWSGIADQLLDDASRGAELRELNHGRTMPDGAVIDADTLFVEPGWTLVAPTSVAGSGSGNTTTPASPASTSADTPDRMPRPAAAAPVADDTSPADQDDADAGGGDGDGTNVEADPELAEWTVEPGDNMWAIAEEILEDATGGDVDDDEITPYWREVIDANLDNLLPPEDPDLIYPGQVLDLPPVADEVLDDDAADPQATGDTSTAATSAGDAAAASAPASDDTTVADDVQGAADGGDLVAADRSAPGPAATVEPADESATEPSADVRAGLERAERHTGVLDVANGGSLGGAGAAVASGGGTGVPLEPDTVGGRDTAVDAAVDDEGATAAPWGVLATGGLGVVAAGVVGVVRRLRRRRLQRRRAEGMTAPPPPVTATEEQLRAAQDPGTVWLVDRVLRDLAAHLDPHDPPAIAGLVLRADRHLSVLLTQPHQPPAGWTAAHATEWERDLRQVDPDVLADAVHYPGPLPTIVTIGTTSTSMLSLNLEHLEVTTISGSPSDVTATMATMALELAASPLADDIDVVCVGFARPLSDTLSRIRTVDVDEAVQLLVRRAGEVDELVSDLPAAAPAMAGRLAGVAASWTPTVVFDPSGEAAPRLAEVIARVPRCGLALVAGGDTVEADWRLQVDGDVVGLAATAGFASGIELVQDRTNLTDRQLGEIAMLIDHELTAPDVAATPPDYADAAPDAADRPRVRLLGPARIDGLAVTPRRSHSIELIAYLALHPNGVSGDTLMERLWPGQTPDTNRLNRVVSDARKALGVDDTGQHRLPHVRGTGGSPYRLAPAAVSCDLADLHRILADVDDAGDDTAAAALLTDALELVDGEPFTGAADTWGWPYSHGLATNAITAIERAALRLGHLALAAGDIDQARWATTRGRLAITSVPLYELGLDIAAAAGSIVEAEAIMTEARAALTDDDGPEYDDMLLGDLTTTYTRLVRERFAA